MDRGVETQPALPVLRIGVPVTRQNWWQTLRSHVRDHVGETVQLVVLHDPAEALDGRVDVVVMDDTADFLTAGQVGLARDRPVRVVGLFHAASQLGRGRDWLADLGIAEADLLPVEASPAELLRALSVLHESVRARRRNGALAAPGQRSRGGPAASSDGGGVGKIVGIGHGTDTAGGTELGVSFARELSSRGRTVLVDLDEHNPSVAVRLGYEVTPNVLDALAALRSGEDLKQCVSRRASFATDSIGFDVVCGLADPADWGQLRDIPALLDALARSWDWVVIDTGPSCSAEEIPPHGLRNAATRAVMESADVVVGVCRATPPGVARFLEWAASAAGLLADTPLWVVVNGAPPEQFHRGQLRGHIRTHLPDRLVSGIDFIGRDRGVEAAVWDARSYCLTGAGAIVNRFAPPAPTRSSVTSKLRGAMPKVVGRR